MPTPQGTNLILPTGWAITVGTSSQLALPANPTRGGLIWVNQGSVAVAICPNVLNVVSAGAVTGQVIPQVTGGVAAIGGAGSITMQPGDKFIIDNMPCGCQWNAIAASGTGVLTAFETY